MDQKTQEEKLKLKLQRHTNNADIKIVILDVKYSRVFPELEAFQDVYEDSYLDLKIKIIFENPQEQVVAVADMITMPGTRSIVLITSFIVNSAYRHVGVGQDLVEILNEICKVCKVSRAFVILTPNVTENASKFLKMNKMDILIKDNTCSMYSRPIKYDK